VCSAHDHDSPASTGKAQVVYQQQRSRHMHHDGRHCTHNSKILNKHQQVNIKLTAMQLSMQQITAKLSTDLDSNAAQLAANNNITLSAVLCQVPDQTMHMHQTIA